jgi:predicted lipoprotein with Yx(FWY)xxD motif
MKKIFIHTILFAAVFLVAVTLVLSGCSPVVTEVAGNLQYTMTIAYKSDVGKYLADGKGMTLYYVTTDGPGKSNVTGNVLANWPVFYTANYVVAKPLDITDFGSIERNDRSMQTTYRGRPLYYYIKDRQPGDVLGNKIGGVWFVINPDTFPPPIPGGSY